jgi:hypothetical protein
MSPDKFRLQRRCAVMVRGDAEPKRSGEGRNFARIGDTDGVDGVGVDGCKEGCSWIICDSGFDACGAGRSAGDMVLMLELFLFRFRLADELSEGEPMLLDGISEVGMISMG